MSLIILGGLVLDTDAKIFINKAGITGSIEKKAVNYLAKALKSNGLWNKFYALYPMAGGTANAHSYNLKNTALYQITWVNAPTHSSTGVDFNGTTQYGDTGLTPDGVITANDSALHFYSRQDTVTGGADASATDLTNTWTIAVRFTGDVTICDQYNGGGGRLSVANTNGSGFFTDSRTSSSSHVTYRNGSSLGSNTTSGANPPTKSIYIGAQNNNGTAALYNSRECALFAVSSGFTAAEASSLNTIIDTYQKKLSRNV